MKIILTTCLFSLFLCGFYVPCAAQCATASNIYLFNFNSKSYEVVKEKKTWAAAAACAVARGGLLAHIETNAEAVALYNAISSAGVAANYTSVDDGGGIAYVWIGATDAFSEGNWIWAGNNTNTNDKFWTGQGAAGTNNGAVFSGKFNKWGSTSTGTRNEPDDFNFAQDAAAIALATWPSCAPTCIPPLGVAGEWNDIAASNTLYYIIEYATLLKAELINFTVKNKDNKAQLNWQTASEINVKNFEIERSFDGKLFEKITEIKANNTLPTYRDKLSVYLAFDDYFSQASYYRLKINDLDGQFNYSKIIFLEKNDAKNIKIAQNTEGSILIETNDKIELITITNTMGQLIKSTRDKAFNLIDVPFGIYIISVKTDKEYLSQKVFKN